MTVKSRASCFKIVFLAATLLVALKFPQSAAGGRVECDLSKKFLCDDGKTCIPKSYLCNIEKDCPGGEDETDCDIPKCENDEKLFKCRTSGCIGAKLLCDDAPDCNDASDESDTLCDKIRGKRGEIEQLKVIPMVSCDPATQFQCSKYACIPNEEVCNGAKNCLNGEDEDKKMCDEQKEKFKCPGFKCKNGVCLERIQFTCDGKDDCGDGSDEEHCATDCKLSNNKFMCHSGDECLDIAKVCNGVNDCPDNSDEGEQCKQKEACDKLDCKGKCVLLPSGPTCTCDTGFEYNSATRGCDDINECLIFGTCSQGCVNTNGSYYCTCEKNFLLNEDKKSCDSTSSDVSLVYTTRKAIKRVSIGQRNAFFHDMVQKAKQPVGVAFDGESYYWTEVEMGREIIAKANAQGGSKKQILLTNGLELPEYLVVDWLTKNIYFTDSARQHIAVCTNDGYHCTELIKNNSMISSPRAIAIHPIESLLFWSDWGNNSHIGSAYMDGSHSKILINDVAWPNGLTLDWPNGRIYWIDAKLDKIESATIFGGDRRIILDGVFKHPFAMAVHGNNLYWCDHESRSIEYCNKFTGKQHDTLSQGEEVFDVHVFDKASMPQIRHACIDHMCSHICLLSYNNTYTCGCPMDMELDGDQHSCVYSKKAYTLIFGIGPYLTLKPFQVFGRSIDIEPKIMPHWFDSIEYNSLTGDIFYADNHKHQLSIVDSQGSSHILIDDPHLTVSSMSFDYFANNLYWANEKEGTIEVLSMTTKKRAILYHYRETYRPNAIVLVPSIGEMFVALVSSEHAHIDRQSIKGEMFDDKHVHVIETGLSNHGPFHFAVDEEKKKIYWSDTGNRKIEFSNFDRTERKPFAITERAPASIALVGDYLHWVSRRSDSLRWRNKTSKGQLKSSEFKIPKSLNKNDYPDVVNLVAGSPLKISKHPCMVNNGGCSDICISDGPTTRMCLCEVGSEFLDGRNTTCVKRSLCDFRCKSGECIEAAKKCDNRPDCKDKSDEAKELCGVRNLCFIDEFRCDDGQCIPSEQKCDKNFNCNDKSDEKNCPKDGELFKCESNQIQCPGTKICIYTTQVCDQTKDCPDGFDESAESCNRKCHETEFKCASGQCIPKEFKCNGQIDCVDGTDEHNGCVPICKSPKKACGDGHCIPEKLFCDGNEDCRDGFDEKNCGDVETPCELDEFQCRATNMSGTQFCIPRTKICDHKNDCPLGDDEKGCDCPRHMFECESGQCIPVAFRCDGLAQCKDNSDEKDCVMANADSHMNAVTCSKDTFRCSDGICLNFEDVCNDEKDCEDDEGPTCKVACDAKTCDQICHETPKGPVCACREGYELKAKGERRCADIDECLSNPCSQLCTNTIGSFKCSCYDGYTFTSSKIECKARGKSQKLFYILYDQVRMISESTQLDEDILYDPMIPLSDLAVDSAKDIVIVSSEDAGELAVVRISDSSVVKRYTSFPKSRLMAYDWITQNVYLVHKPLNERVEIHVCNLASEKCVLLRRLAKYTELISSIDVDPVHNYVFYIKTSMTFYGKFSGEIVRMRLDGSDEKTIFSEDSQILLRALATDIDREAVFFTEVSSQSLQAINYEGEKIKTFAHQSKNLRRPLALSLFENHAYVLDEKNSKITKCKLYGDNNCVPLEFNTGVASRFVISHQLKQRQRENFCESHRCSEICINADMGVKCMCTSEGGLVDASFCPELENVNSQQPIIPRGQSHAALWLFLSMMVVTVGALFAYLVYKKRGFQHKWNINIHFDGKNGSTVKHFKRNLKECPTPNSGAGSSNVPSAPAESENCAADPTKNGPPAGFSQTVKTAFQQQEDLYDVEIDGNNDDYNDHSRLID